MFHYIMTLTNKATIDEVLKDYVEVYQVIPINRKE